MTLEVSEQEFLGDLNSIHLRIYKREMNKETFDEINENCSLFSGINVSLSILTPDNRHLIHNSILTYEDLLTEKWMDFTSFKDIYNDSMHSGTVTVLHLELDIWECPLLTLQDIGMEVERGREPILAVFAKENDDTKMVEQQLNRTIQNQRSKRQIEGSGNANDAKVACRLIEHKVNNNS